MSNLKSATCGLLLLLVSASPIGPAAYAQTGESGRLVVTITGMEEDKGSVRIALFDSEKSFTREALDAAVLPVSERRSEWILEHLPFGNYAVAVFHDENDNGKLDRNFLGIPREPYGFSNDARGIFGPPHWTDARFQHDTPEKRIEVRVR